MRSKLNEFLNESLSRGMLAMVTFLPTASTGAFVMGGLVWGGVVWEASVSSSCAASEKSQTEILWEDNLDAAIRRSEKTGKPLMIHFYGDNCPPCRMLEKKAFRDESLIQTMNSSVIAVRINAERELKTALRFRVNRWPTDVYFYPNGEEIYRNVSNQDPAVFEKIIAKVADKNSQRREASSTTATLASYPKTSVTATVPNDTLAALTPATQIPATQIPATQGPARIRLTESTFNSVDTAEVAQSTSPSLPKDVTSAQTPSSPVVAEATQPLLASKGTDESQVVSAAANVPSNLPEATAMGGHCPVTLRAAIDASKAGRTPSAAWVLGSPEHTARHRGRTYYFSTAETRDVFLKDPDRYAPVLSGCDLVEYSKSGKWIDGDCRYGFIEQESGRIFLFSSSSNCQEFARNCEAYSSMGSKRTGVE